MIGPVLQILSRSAPSILRGAPNALRLLQGARATITNPGTYQAIRQAAAPFFTPSSAFSKVPVLKALPPWAQATLAPSSVAGAIAGLTSLEGSTPQSEDPYGRWQQLGYSSRGQMQQMIGDRMRLVGTLSTLGGKEVAWRGKDLGWQRTYSEGANAPPPASDLNSSLYGGPQAGQWTPPIPPARPGVVSNGAGVPAQRQNVIDRSLSQEVLNAAQQYAAPTNVPLSSFYEGQQQLGRSMMQQGTLLSELQRLNAAPGMTPENLKAWAQRNPDLAYREYLRLKQM